MKGRAIILVIAVLLFSRANSQNACRPDSAKCLIEQAQKLKQGNILRASEKIRKALQWLPGNCDIVLRAEALNHYADISKEQGNWKAAVQYNNQAINILLQAIPKESQKVSGAYLSLGNIYNAEAAYFERNELFDLADSSVYQAYKNYNIALKYADTAGSSNLKGKALLNLGTAAYKLFKDKEANDYFERALTIANSTGDSNQIALAFLNKGNLADGKDRSGAAQNYYLKAKRHFVNSGDFRNWINVNINLADLNFPQRSEKSLSLLKEADSLAEVLKMNTQRGLIHEFLYAVYKKRGEYKEALTHFEAYRSIQDSILSASFKDKELQVRYETAKQQELLERARAERYEKELALIRSNQKSEVYRLWILIVSLLALSLIAFLAWRNHAQDIIRKQEEKIHEQKLQELEQSKRIEHANALLQGQDKERISIAEEIHDQLGGTLVAARMWNEIALSQDETPDENVQQTQKLLDQAIEDARNIAYNLQPGSLSKFGLKSAIDDLIDNLNLPNGPVFEANLLDIKNLDSQQEFHLYRIFQEILNNAFKHSQASKISISMKYSKGNELFINVKDNGRGFNPDAVEAGIGLKTIQRRASTINAIVNLQSAAGRGTEYSIKVKINEDEKN